MTIGFSTKLESRFVKSADGTTIYADAVGNRSAGTPVIVLIHGFSMVKAVFDPIFKDPKWTSNTFLVRYDTRGHGKSGKPLADEAWQSRRISEDFEAVCKEFGVQRAFVLGWSLGVVHFADIMSHNTSVAISGFVNVGGSPYLDPALTESVATPDIKAALGGLLQPASVDAFQESTLNFLQVCSDNIPPEYVGVLLEGIVVQPRAVAIRVLTREHDPKKLLQEGREGRLELLVVGGRNDRVLSLEDIRAVYKRLGWQKCVFKCLEGADHTPWFSRPEEFRETVLEWVKERHHQTQFDCTAQNC